MLGDRDRRVARRTAGGDGHGALAALAGWRSGISAGGVAPIEAHIHAMPHLDTCLAILRRLIAIGDMNSVPLAERAVNEYWDVTPTKARKSGLRLIQQDVLDQRNAVLGSQRNFADAVNAYIEKKLEEE